MLPIRAPFDTYRVGLWGLWRNIDLVIFCALLLAVFNPGRADALGGSAVPGAGFLVMVVQIFVPALFIYALHATFLSDGRIAGFVAVRDIARLFLVAWRIFVIGLFALLPWAGVLVLTDLVFWDAFSRLGAELGDAIAVALTDLVLVALLFAFSAVAMILLGLRIPEIVDKRDRAPGPGSVRRGASQFWQMAASLAAGPGLFGLIFEAARLGVTIYSGSVVGGVAPADAFAARVAEAAVYLYCGAMIAGVLSDAYRQALAAEGALGRATPGSA